MLGEVDAFSAPILQERLVDLIDGQGNHSIVLDLRAMTFVDSIGLSVMLEADRRLQARGGRLLLAHSPKSTIRLLEMTGLDSVLTLASS